MRRPELPVGFEWVPEPADCAAALEHGVVPVAWPGDRERARRWATVLHGYGDRPVPTRPPRQDDRWLISVESAEAIGSAAALALGRTHRHVPDLCSAHIPEVPAGGSVLLVVPAGLCSFAALHPLLERWAGDGVRAGVLTGLDLPGMTFVLAKILADRAGDGSSPGGDVCIDGTTGIARASADQQPRLAQALTDVCRHLVVDAHGTSAHATVGSYMLCGLVGDRERLADGEPLPDGCTSGRCRAGHGVLDQVLVRDLRCRFVGLFVCNAITLTAREQFPSDVSLAMAALEGHPAAVLGLLRQDVGTTPAEPATALRLLASGVPHGTVASWLSDDAAGHGYPSAYLLLGDPDQARPAAGPVQEPVPWPDGSRPRLPAVTDHAGRPIAALLTRSGPIPPAGPDGAPRVWDADAETSATVATLSGWIADIDQGAHLEDTLRALISIGSKRVWVMTECLERMREHRQAARDLALLGLHAALSCQRNGRGAPDPVPTDELAQHAHGWATALNETVAARAGAFRLWEALDANHRPVGTNAYDACPRCSAPRFHMRLESPLTAIEGRTSVSCPRCGPAVHFPGSHPVEVEAPVSLHPGGTAKITVTLPAAEPDRTGMGLIAAHLQDRSSMTALHTAAGSAQPGDKCDLVLPVPDDLAFDLHRIWVLWAHRFRVSLLQARVPALPESAP